MVKYDDPYQTKIVKFTLPFSGRLDPDNKWIYLADMVPWQELYGRYTTSVCGRTLAGWLSNPGLRLAR